MCTIQLFFHDLFKNADKLKRPSSKLYIIQLNARNMFRRWLEEITTFSFLKSLWAFLKLYDAGFRIGNFNPQPSDEYERFRFFWKNRMIRDMADINRYQDHYSTTLNGHVEDLNK